MLTPAVNRVSLPSRQDSMDRTRPIICLRKRDMSSTYSQDINAKEPSRQNANGVPAYNNTQFDTTFTDSLLNFARFLNPNNRGDPDNIAPLWDTWSDGKVEMLFNKTEANLPIVKTITTSQALLDRCMYVFTHYLLPATNLFNWRPAFRFWDSVSVDTAQ